MITLHTWQKEVARVGEYWARRNLRHITRSKRQPYRSDRPEAFKLLSDLAHLPDATPNENRKKYAEIFRMALQRIREDRLRVNSYTAIAGG